MAVAANFGADIGYAGAGARRCFSDTCGWPKWISTKPGSRIGATVTSRVIEINAAQLGQQVKVGDALAVINSTELGQAQLDYLRPAPRPTCSRAASRRRASCLPPT